MKMLNNNIMDDRRTVSSPMVAGKRARGSDAAVHELCTRPPFTGGWKTETNSWSKVNTDYAKIKCSQCKKKIRTYCKCNKKVPLCTECYAIHVALPDDTN